MQIERLRRPAFVIPALLWAFLVFGCLPNGHAGMVLSQEGSGSVRDQNLGRIQAVLANEQVRNRLSKLGLSSAEAARRLEQLSDRDIQRLADQADSIESGQGIVAIAGIIVFFLFLLLAASAVAHGSHTKGQTDSN